MFGLPMSLYAYAGGFNHPFRSDTYLAYNFFNTLSFNLKNMLKVARFEMFGHRRIIPLSHLIMFIQYKILGTNHFLYHLFQYLLHVINSVLTYFLVKRLTRNNLAACIASLLFITFYSHFDIINWTYHTFVMLSCTSFLIAFLAIQTYFQKPKQIYLFAGLVLLFSAMLVYESNVLLPCSGVLFFLFLFYRNKPTDFDVKKPLKFLSAGVFISYLIFLAIFYVESQHYKSPVSSQIQDQDIEVVDLRQKAVNDPWEAAERLGISRTQLNRASGGAGNGEVEFSQMFTWKNIIGAVLSTTDTLLDTMIIKNAGFPSEIDIGDIIYLKKTTFQPRSVVFIAASVCLFVFLISFRLKKKDILLLLLFFVILTSSTFIISLGRGLTAPPGYVPSQPHYAYFPNIIILLIVSFLINEKGSFKCNNGYLLLIATLVITVLNSVKIHEHTALTSEKLSGLSRHISEIKKIEEKGDKEAKIFIDFPVFQANKTFNLGTDIALDVYFKDIITKNIYEAKYLYNQEEGISLNPLYGKNYYGNKDFTVEFIYYQGYQHNIKGFTLIGKRRGTWWLGVSVNGQLQLKADLVKGRERVQRVFKTGIIIPPGKWHHLSAQREGDRFYLALDGEVKLAMDVNDYDIDIDKETSDILGEIYTGAGSVVFANRLYIKGGMAKYDLKGKEVGNKVKVSSFAPPW